MGAATPPAAAKDNMGMRPSNPHLRSGGAPTFNFGGDAEAGSDLPMADAAGGSGLWWPAADTVVGSGGRRWTQLRWARWAFLFFNYFIFSFFNYFI